jgi:hypothetical protein
MHVIVPAIMRKDVACPESDLSEKIGRSVAGGKGSERDNAVAIDRDCNARWVSRRVLVASPFHGGL